MKVELNISMDEFVTKFLDGIDTERLASYAADHIDLEEVASHIDVSKVTQHVNLEVLAEEIWDRVGTNWLIENNDVSENIWQRVSYQFLADNVDLSKLAREICHADLNKQLDRIDANAEVTELRAEVAALKSEVAALREVTGQFANVIAAFRALRSIV